MQKLSLVSWYLPEQWRCHWLTSASCDAGPAKGPRRRCVRQAPLSSASELSVGQSEMRLSTLRTPTLDWPAANTTPFYGARASVEFTIGARATHPLHRQYQKWGGKSPYGPGIPHQPRDANFYIHRTISYSFPLSLSHITMINCVLSTTFPRLILQTCFHFLKVCEKNLQYYIVSMLNIYWIVLFSLQLLFLSIIETK